MTTVAAPGADVVVREWGGEGGRPLVFWHGLNPFGALQLNEAGPVWAARGFRALAPTAPGLGESPAFADLEDYRPTRIADLVVDLADNLGLERFDYVGWSWGASIGVHLASRHPARLMALVLLDAGHTDLQDMPEWAESTLDERIAEWEANPVTFPDWEAFLSLARERATTWRPALEERLRAGMYEHDGAVVARGDFRAAAAAIHWLGVEPPSSTLPVLARLDLPILLVLAARDDTTGPAERFRAAVPEAEIATIDSEHDLFSHAPDETATLVADWLVRRRLASD